MYGETILIIAGLGGTKGSHSVTPGLESLIKRMALGIRALVGVNRYNRANYNDSNHELRPILVIVLPKVATTKGDLARARYNLASIYFRGMQRL